MKPIASKEGAASLQKGNAAPRRFRLILAGLFAALLAVAAIVLIPTKPQMKWLAHGGDLPAEESWAGLVRGKLQRINWMASFWRWYYNRRPSIEINGIFVSLTNATARQIGLGEPLTTNADGTHAWLLDPGQMDALEQRLKTLPDATNFGRPRVITLNGFQVQLSQTSERKPGSIDMSLRVRPKLSGGSVGLSVEVTAVEAVGISDKGGWQVRTNVNATFDAVLRDGGAVVIDDASSSREDGGHHLSIVRPILVDRAGNPIAKRPVAK